LIKVDNLKISFNGFVAVDTISFEVAPGQVVGILGSNGAGKSSTMKALAGIIRPESGTITIDDRELTSIREEEEAKKVVGYCPDVGGLVVGATPREHIQLLLSLRGKEKDYDLGLYLIQQIGLEEFIDTPVGGFSHGMSRRLSVLLATLSSQKVLILDEPFDGVDPIGVDAIEKIIHEAKSQGLAVVVCTHLQSILTRVVDDLVIMKSGHIMDFLPANELSGEIGEARYKEILETSGATDRPETSSHAPTVNGIEI
jgi:ABC-2 type transport system ATP-binding protein